MCLLALLLFQLYLHSTRAKIQRDSCFKNSSSFECTELIRSRYNLTLDEVESVRSRIKYFANSDFLRITAPGISAFDMAMHCYAVGPIGERLPSDGRCVSCHHCKSQVNSEVCDFFCPPIPALAPVFAPIILQPQATGNTRQPALITAENNSLVQSTIGKITKDIYFTPFMLGFIIFGIVFAVLSIVVGLSYIFYRFQKPEDPVRRLFARR